MQHTLHEKRSLLAGLIGANIQASLTPAMHEREGAELGLRYVYRVLDLTQMGEPAPGIRELLTAAGWMGYAGLNITHPCKQSVMPVLDEVSADATQIGAVNTVVFSAGRSVGYNTDIHGYTASFRRELDHVDRHHVVMLGAGGAGHAVGYAALALGVTELSIFDVQGARAAALAQRLSARFGAGRAVACENLAAAVGRADGIINASPVGMAAHPGSPLPATLLRPALWVSDIVYFPLETQLVREATGAGCRVMRGGGMAVFQAVEAFRLITGVRPDAERMLRHFGQLTAKS